LRRVYQAHSIRDSGVIRLLAVGSTVSIMVLVFAAYQTIAAFLDELVNTPN